MGKEPASTVTVTAHCDDKEHVHVSIRTGMHQLDECFYVVDGKTEIRDLHDGQSIQIVKEKKT